MAIITISRQPYSFGDEIAKEIAKKLNYKVIDKFIINNKVKDFHCNFSDELQDLANEKEPGFFKHFFKKPQVYNCLVQAILFEEASHDNKVILGRGSQYILNQPYVLNIRIMAPFDVRCSYLEKKEDVTHILAEKLLDYANKIEKAQPLTDDDKENFKRLSLEKRVEAMISKEISEHIDLKVECKKMGHIKITGSFANEIERNKIFKLTQLCHGVNSVNK